MHQVRQKSKQVSNVRTIVGRLLPKTDLIAGIEAICLEHGVKNGTIVSCIGSLNFARFVWATPDPFAKLGFKYGEPTVLAGPLEFIAAQGTIGTLKDNKEKIFVHMHIVVTDDQGVTWSGHVKEEGNQVCCTMEIVIQAFDGVEITRAVDEESDVAIFDIG
ncbi:MAG: DNA-binding protein [Synergistaceae bacterium]|jgi:predicted DNA-binding protein with PD1-like motif|nr:DNA-binding protein [Synergistaceae bacterium]